MISLLITTKDGSVYTLSKNGDSPTTLSIGSTPPSEIEKVADMLGEIVTPFDNLANYIQEKLEA